MTGTTPDQAAFGLDAKVSSRRGASGRWRRLACAWLGVGLLACGGGESGGGSSDSGGGDPPPLATAPVDLPPGQTVAELAWEPSAGFVTSYLVFVSRNHSTYTFDQSVPSPSVSVPGAPGDAIRITVFAMSEDGTFSPASPPSVEVRFHAAAADASAVATNDPTPMTLVMGGAPVAQPVDDMTLPVDEVPPTAEAIPASDSDTAAAGEPGSPPASDELLSRAARERLLLADARLPLVARESAGQTGTGATDAGTAWIEAHVANEISPEVTLVGTAERAESALRDLVWRDATGQLSVSDGAALIESQEVASTRVPAIRLGATERFVALADVDGDGLRDWITEETTTGAAWIRTDDATTPRSARAAHQPATARLLGSGEFDGAAAAELLWRNEDGSLAIERPAGAGPEILIGALPPLGLELVAIADLDGDGRDDLIARGEDGRLAIGLTAIDEQTGGFWIEWSEGHAEADASLPLVATLDLDLDGRAELAWLVGDSVEVRGLGETTPQAFEF